MNQPVTFFHNRQSEEGRSYVFDLESSTRIYKVFVHARRPVDAAEIQSRKIFDYQQEILKVYQAVGPGGVVVVTFEKEGTRSFQVAPLNAAESGVGSFGVLRPGSEMSLEEVKLDKWLLTPAGSHLLVPVDREAEEQLRQMKGFLDELPPDLESLILYSLRKPSLDARIRDLEAGRAKAAGGLMNQILLWLVPALLVILLGFSVATFFRAPRQDKGASGTQGGKTDTNRADCPSVEPPEMAKHDQEIFKVLQAVQGKAKAVAAYQSLSEGNFKEQNIPSVLKAPDQAQLLALGLMKLEALRLDATKAAGLFDDADNPTLTKSVFQAIGEEALKNDSRDLLAALGCAVYGLPGIKETEPKRGQKSPAHLFVKGVQDCKSFPLDKATPGLKKLSEFVESYPPPSTQR